MTGEFYREGNIYTDTDIYQDETIVMLLEANPPIPAAREEVFIAASTRVKYGDLVLGAEA